MTYIKKEEYIKLFGEEAWLEHTKKKREYNRKYAKDNKEKKNAYRRDYYKKNIDKFHEKNQERKDYYKKWREENAEYKKQKDREYYLLHKDEHNKRCREYYAEYSKNNTDKIKEKNKRWGEKYYKTQLGRAKRLEKNYRRHDEDAGREGFSLSHQFIIDKIFTSKCIYCGDSNWQHLGCDRIDGSKPHTEDNVVCSCAICNIEREGRKMSVEEFIEYRKTHPRDEEPQKLEKVVEINGVRVIKKVG